MSDFERFVSEKQFELTRRQGEQWLFFYPSMIVPRWGYVDGHGPRAEFLLFEHIENLGAVKEGLWPEGVFRFTHYKIEGEAVCELESQSFTFRYLSRPQSTPQLIQALLPQCTL